MIDSNMEHEDEDHYHQAVDFCTLGMFIIDEIHYLPPKPPVFNILGGGGSYAALGARLFSPPPLSKKVGWIVDAGSDFPPELGTMIDAWQTSCTLRQDPSRLTTRGWNGYDESENRAFKYTTPKLRITDADLPPSLLFSSSFHLICSPTRCIELCTSILRRRKTLEPSTPKPLFIWEPVPDRCLPTELLNCTNALPYVDICSPNANELAGFLGDSEIDPETGLISTKFVERACEQLLSSMPLQSFSLVVRCGAQGCYVAKNGGRSSQRRPKANNMNKSLNRSQSKKLRPANRARGGLTLDMDMFALFADLPTSADGSFTFEREEVVMDPGIERWLPAYFDASNSFNENGMCKVVDPTGAGNGFLGAMAVALARGKGVVESAAWGSVGASFMIERVGVPLLTRMKKGDGSGSESGEREGEEEGELWNQEGVEWRLERFKEKCGGW